MSSWLAIAKKGIESERIRNDRINMEHEDNLSMSFNLREEHRIGQEKFKHDALHNDMCNNFGYPKPFLKVKDITPIGKISPLFSNLLETYVCNINVQKIPNLYSRMFQKPHLYHGENIHQEWNLTDDNFAIKRWCYDVLYDLDKIEYTIDLNIYNNDDVKWYCFILTFKGKYNILYRLQCSLYTKKDNITSLKELKWHEGRKEAVIHSKDSLRKKRHKIRLKTFYEMIINHFEI